MATTHRVPVTVLTGFLGSGKTTLLNRILSEHHGKRIAVIENEFGEVGVDSQLVIGAEEELFETNNGCICCTVRGDLLRILNSLMKRRDRFDYIVIETTGLADPGPVAQTFFLDADLKSQFVLDAIVTVVDAKHVEGHLVSMDETAEQIAFADVILLNKVDLVGAADLERIERRIRSINAPAKIFRTRNADVPIERVLDLGAFDLERALGVDATFLEPEYPFEWAGAWRLERGLHTLRTGSDTGREPAAHDHEHDHDHDHDHGQDHGHVLDHGRAEAHDDHAPAAGSHSGHPHGEGLGIVMLPLVAADSAALESQIEVAVRSFATEPLPVAALGGIAPDARLRRIDVFHGPARFEMDVHEAGVYALFCEHAPAEFGLRVEGSEPLLERAFASHHHHDEEIASIGIVDERPLDAKKLNDWLSYLLQSRGQDIFRMKGVLSLRGEDRRYVFHGVHMMFDGRLERPWGAAVRRNSLIFIGRHLDRDELEAGFASAVA
jgi:G3E family GTPase